MKLIKKFLAAALATAMVVPAVPVPGVVFAAPADSFYSSFETSDPAINPVSVASENLVHSVTSTSQVISVADEYTNYTGVPAISPAYVSSSATEGVDKIIDQDVTTKLCLTGNESNPGNNAAVVCPVTFTFTYDAPVSPKAYYIAGADDDMQETGRVLNTWVLEGFNDSEEWVELDSRAAVAWTANQQVQNFAVRNTGGEYTQLRLRVLRRGAGAGITNGGIIQFSGFGAYENAVIEGNDGTTAYDGLAVSTGDGPAQLWGNTSARANRGWTGDRALRVRGEKTAADAYAYTKIYDGLEIEIAEDTKLSYMVMPYMNSDVQANEYDSEYTSNYTAVDLEFTDGTFLRDYNATDQYGFDISPREQGDAGIIEQNNWLKVTGDLGDVAALRGKIVQSILVGYDKPDGTPGLDVDIYYDDIEIFRAADPVVENLAEYVNIVRGTQNGAYNEDHNKYAHGLNNPIVSTPHPFNFWSPSTTMAAQTTYQYTGSQANFKQIHLNHVASNWIGESGVFDFSADSTTVFTTAAALNTALRARGSNFLHENEIAHPHYYGVTFNQDDAKAPGVKVEVTPTEHAAVLRFTFPEGAAQRNVILDSAKARSNSNSSMVYNGDGTFDAFTTKAENGQKRMYVHGEFNVIPSAFNQAGGGNTPMSLVSFAPVENGPTVVELKVSTSFISADQARKNMSLEIAPADDFDAIMAKALSIWNEKLSVITVEDPDATYDQLSSLYSNLYRAFVYPILDSENVGTNESPDWRYASPYSGTATNFEVLPGRLFYNNGFWDTYRSAWPLYSLTTPEKDTDLLNGLVQHYIDTGWVPRWIAPSGTNSMVGTNSDSIFGDAMSMGVEFNYEDAYDSSLKNATVYSPNNGSNFYSGRAGMAQWPFLGYSPTGSLTDENLSWSLEAGVADFGIASMSKILRDRETPGTEEYRKLNDEYIYFINRSQNFVHEFNPALGGWFRGKTAAGEWLWPDDQFDPTAFGYGYTEDNAWNYAFHAPQDGRGLANLYGGQEALGDKLDEMFAADPAIDFGNWPGWHKEKVESRGSKLGQMHMSNEPAFHIPYMYLFTDRPWKTADVVRDILDRHFAGSDIGQGYIGDDDNGEMSSWYVLSALGLYPLEGGNGQYVFGSPLFKKVSINRDNGETITLTAPNVSRTNKYIQSVELNGQETNVSYIDPSFFEDGATIEFNMGAAPSESFGVGLSNQPPSLSKDDKAPAPLADLTTAVIPRNEMPSGSADAAYTSAANGANLFNNTSAGEAAFAEGSQFIYYYFAKGATVDMYTLTSAAAGNAPAAWTLSGSADGDSWTTLDVRENQVFDWDRYTRPFTINSPGRYKYYRVEFSGGAFNLTEFELLGGALAMVNKDALAEAVRFAEEVVPAEYAPENYAPLAEALAAAKGVYDDADATDEEIEGAIALLEAAMDGLIKIKPAADYFDAVDFNMSANSVKAEMTEDATGAVSGDITNIGGLTPDSYVGYRYVDFGDGGEWWSGVKLIYAGKAADLLNSRVVVHLDALDGPVIAEFPLEATGDEWNVYEEAKGALTKNDIKGLQTVFFEFRGRGASVANVHAFAFETTTHPTLGVVNNNLTDDMLTTDYQYQNETDGDQNLLLITAVYDGDEKLRHTGFDFIEDIAAGDIVDFAVEIAADGIKDAALTDDYSIGVYLWDADTMIPVIPKYVEKAADIVTRRALGEAKAAIEAGEYNMPSDLADQAAKTAWVQERVNALIPDGNDTVATVTYDGNDYIVSLANGTVTDSAVISVIVDITVTFSAPDAGYVEQAKANAFGTVTLPADPVRENYYFLGWYYKGVDGDYRFTEDTVVSADMTAIAKWASAPAGGAYALMVFDDPVVNERLQMAGYSAETNSENGGRAADFRGDIVGRIDTQEGFNVGRFMYARMPQSFPELRDARNVVFEITYYDVGNGGLSFETADVTKTGTERDFGNRHSIPRNNSGELVTYKLYLENVGMRLGQNGGNDFRINGGGSAPNMHIKSISIYPGARLPVEQTPPPAFAGESDLNNLMGKTMTGYQLWFTASPTNGGWVHWSRNTRPTEYGTITFENYPDVRDYPAAALSNTGLPNLANGSPSQLFTSKRADVIDLHFSWLEQYGIDGVAVQRFASEVVTSETPTRNHVNLVQDAAERTGKAFYVMYDFSGQQNNTRIVSDIMRDWVYSIESKGIVSSPNYAYAEGKPVVSLWGLSGEVSESDGNRYISSEYALEIVNWFKSRGYYVIGGTPDNDWSERTDDYAEVYASLDMITPWFVGRYGRNSNDVIRWLDAHVPREIAYTEARGMEYQPVVFQGFNWSSFQPAPPNEIPRAAGELFWTQIKYLKNNGIDMAYFAMFDEYDEGTAYMKTAEDSSMLPVGVDPYFQTFAADGRWLSSDFYLRLAGEGVKLLKDDSIDSVDMNMPVPIPHSLGPVYWRNGFESRRQQPNPNYAGGFVSVDVGLYNDEVIASAGVAGANNEIVMEDSHNGSAFSFDFSGTGASASSSYRYQIAETTILTPAGLQLSYWINAGSEAGKAVYVDLLFEDGTLLSDSDGYTKKAASSEDAWEQITLDVPAAFVGKTIIGVVVSYDGEGDYEANIDDIVIQVRP